MFGLVVMEGMTPSGLLSNINEMFVIRGPCPNSSTALYLPCRQFSAKIQCVHSILILQSPNALWRPVIQNTIHTLYSNTVTQTTK